jgi:hypothetical protein
MTRKDYIVIAEAINCIPDDNTRRQVAAIFCNKLAATNANFRPERFLRAALKESTE